MAEQRLEDVRKNRLKKAEELRGAGVNPYPSKVNKDFIPALEARQKEGELVNVAGRIWGLRSHGNSTFADLKDETGKIQLFFQKDTLKGLYSLVKLLDIGDFIWASGKVFKTEAGELTIDVYELQLLTKSIRPLPSSWHGLKDVEERYRQRYVDLLLNEEVRHVFEKKSQVIKLLRDRLNKEGFIEARTPALQPIYGGASAMPFITRHNALDHDFYLRISDELYLKRLVVGGYDKVFEICTDFRNEGIDRWHNPEFTMCEFYWAYADYDDLMVLSENMLSDIIKEVTGSYEVTYGEMKINFAPPWNRLSYKDAFLEHFGIDIDGIQREGDLAKTVKDKFKNIDLSAAYDRASILDASYKAVIRDKLINPVFLIDHPYEMRPLAKRKDGDSSKVESMQLVAGGAELINAYSELNDPVDQRKRWEEEMRRAKKGVKEYQVVDEDYIRALEYGMPPTAGWGLGIDRFTALLTNQHSLKDVILFPTLRPENGKKHKSK